MFRFVMNFLKYRMIDIALDFGIFFMNGRRWRRAHEQ